MTVSTQHMKPLRLISYISMTRGDDNTNISLENSDDITEIKVEGAIDYLKNKQKCGDR